MELERTTLRMDVEEVKEDGSDDEPDFKGILSVAGVKDEQDDIIDDGAFTRTLKHHKGRVPLLIDHDHRTRLGVAHLKEEGKKLKLAGFVNKEKQMARDTLSDIKFSLKQKVPLGLSIGFQTIKRDFIDGVRHLKEVALWEGSVVTFPALLRARVTSAKSITSFGDLPMAEIDHAWDRAAADARVRAWAKATDAPNEDYRKAFIFSDPNSPDSFNGCRLQFADVVDGKLTAIPRAIFAAVGVLQGGFGGAQAKREDVERALMHTGKYYEKMNIDSPCGNLDNFELELWGAADYATFIKSKAAGLPNRTREAIEETAKALNALLAPADDVIDARKLHSIYEETSEAWGLSKEKESHAAVISDYDSFLDGLMTP